MPTKISKVYKLVEVVESPTKRNNKGQPVQEWRPIAVFTDQEKLNAYLTLWPATAHSYEVQEYQAESVQLSNPTYEGVPVDPVIESPVE